MFFFKKKTSQYLRFEPIIKLPVEFDRNKLFPIKPVHKLNDGKHQNSQFNALNNLVDKFLISYTCSKGR